MSNPGVVTLAKAEIAGRDFRVEDNIGEAIHIHYGSIRLDLSISEFERIANELITIAERLVDVGGFRFEKYDAIFLTQVCQHLLQLKKIEITKRMISDLMTSHFVNGVQELIPISEGRIVKGLKGDLQEISTWKQVNYYGDDTNVDRMNSIYSSIKNNGYCPDKKGTYIVVLNGGNMIVDGCHRASSLFMQYGNIEIPVSNWITKRNERGDEGITKAFEKEKALILRNKVHENKRIMLQKEMIKILVKNDLRGKRVLIKGGGEHTRQLLNLCGNEMDIVGIIDKKKEQDQLYGYDVIDINSIGSVVADIILISSYVYRNEMKDEIEAYSSANGLPIYDFYDNGIEKEFFT